jgi:hypothetical protein
MQKRPNPSTEGMPKRVRLLCNPRVKRSLLTALQASRELGLHSGTVNCNLYGVLGLVGCRTCSGSY